jgi:hypothetical protein
MIKRIYFYSVLIMLFGGCIASKNNFHDIFDGKTLQGWEGDPTYWRVENGNLVGEVTPSSLLKRNSFIIWRGGEVKDFELIAEYRITKNGNSGINYRSDEIPGVSFALRGYQGDIDGMDEKPYTGMNYEERRRTTIAKRGQKVVLPPLADADSLQKHIDNNVWTASVVVGSLGDNDSLTSLIHDAGEWNEYRILAVGNHLQHFINGVLVCDVTDNDPVNARLSGLIGVQVHVGPPMKVEYRNFRLRNISR